MPWQPGWFAGWLLLLHQAVLLQAYGRELGEAYEWLMKYKSSRKEAELHQVTSIAVGHNIHVSSLGLHASACMLLGHCCPLTSSANAQHLQAWDLYYHVFKRINKQLHGMTQLELQYAAPALVRQPPVLAAAHERLLSMKSIVHHTSASMLSSLLRSQVRATGMELAVPGTYIVGEPLVTIAAFAPQLQVSEL